MLKYIEVNLNRYGKKYKNFGNIVRLEKFQKYGKTTKILQIKIYSKQKQDKITEILRIHEVKEAYFLIVIIWK